MGELRGAGGAEVAADAGALRGDVGLALGLSAGAVERGFGAADDEGGVERQAVERAKFRIEAGENAGGLVNGARAHRGGKYAGRMAGGALDFDFPRRAPAAGDGACFPDGAFKGEGHIAALGGGEELGAGGFHGAADGFLVAGHDDDDARVGEQASGVKGAEGVDDDEVAALDVARAGAEGLVAVAAEVAAG